MGGFLCARVFFNDFFYVEYLGFKVLWLWQFNKPEKYFNLTTSIQWKVFPSKKYFYSDKFKSKMFESENYLSLKVAKINDLKKKKIL